MAIYFATGGTGDHISAGFTGAASGSMSYSVSCWVYLKTIDMFDYRQMAFIYASSRLVSGLFLEPGGITDFGNESVDLVGPTMATGIWTHLASSCLATSATSAKVMGFMNGRLVAVGVVASGSYTGHTPYSMMIGATTDLFVGADAYYEDARFWNRALSADDMMRNYRANMPDQKSLIGWNPLRDTYIRDHSGIAARSNSATWAAAGTAPTIIGPAMSLNRGTDKTLKGIY